jgi:phosphoglycolate phosphatase-like HAD superfamily hydrolase
MRGRFILFDFDGVIVNSTALSFAVSQQFDPDLDHEGYRKLFEGNVYDAFEKKRGPDDGHRDRYFEVYAPRFRAEAMLVPGIDKVIRTLHASYTLAVISSTPTVVIEEFLTRYGMRELFSELLGVDVHTSKVEKIRMVFDKYGATAEDCVFITDTLGDIGEAQVHHVGAIGVVWGLHDRETLERGVPFRIVQKVSEIPDAVTDFFSRARR